ncbi:MAG: NAD(P)/FAD-dependent oxidoreductase [Pseudobdellovibrionaceae bacterium]
MKKERLAIIGSGISGLSAACIFQDRYDVTLFEKEDRLGGHARTITIDDGTSPFPVDTGFIVYNERNYPHLTKFFAHYNVETEDSSMSFGVDMRNLGLSYASTSVAIPSKNWLKRDYWIMLKDILRFNKVGKAYLNAPTDLTLGAFLKKEGFSAWFCNYYLRPMGAAIWSCPLKTIDAYPAATFLRFFDNHGLLTVFDQPDWRTVKGGSRQYIEKILSHLNIALRLNSAIQTVSREGTSVIVTDTQGQGEEFDLVIFATHADQTVRILDQMDETETEILSGFRFQPNRVVVHGDTSLMPKTKRDWASWVYLSEAGEDDKEDVSLSYWMNNLQTLATTKPVIVTLNPSRLPDDTLIYDTHDFAHPVFTTEAIEAQKRLNEIQGRGGIYHAGAWTRYGFHEDGILSAVRIAEKLGVTPPWM